MVIVEVMLGEMVEGTAIVLVVVVVVILVVVVMIMMVMKEIV